VLAPRCLLLRKLCTRRSPRRSPGTPSTNTDADARATHTTETTLRAALSLVPTSLVARSGEVPWGGVVLDLVRRGGRDGEGHRAMVGETGLGNSRKDIARWPWISLPCSTC